MALCDAEVKNQVKALPSFKEMDKKLDSNDAHEGN